MLRELLRDLLHKIAPSVVNNAVNEAARAELLERRLGKMRRRAESSTH